MARYNEVDLNPARLERLRKAYADSSISVREIKLRFAMSENAILAVARAEGWPLRSQALRAERARPERASQEA